MYILNAFREQKTAVIEQWLEIVYKSYPLDTTGFLRTKEDQFCNPVGEITVTMANYLFDAAAGEEMVEKDLKNALERFVRLRSVQDFTPSMGLGVMFVFKQLFRSAFLEKCVTEGYMENYLEAESRIDTLTLMAFDIYTDSREVLAEQRITEIRNQHSQLVRYMQRRGVSLENFASSAKDCPEGKVENV